MARAGHGAEVRIGVALVAKGDAARGFEAHAWVEHCGTIILGDNGELERYAPMLALRASDQRPRARRRGQRPVGSMEGV